MTRSIFFGYGGWVGLQSGPTTCSFWPDDPTQIQWDARLLIPVDLALNPEAVRAGRVRADAIQVDDKPSDGGLTKLGPTWPTGSTINGVWLESNYYGSLGAARPPRVPRYMQCREYELTTVLYWDGPLAGRRFWGCHAEITAESGSTATVSIWPAGRSLVPNQQPAGSWSLDLAAVGHPIEPGFTEIGVGSAPKVGALFLDAKTVSALALAGPKLPPTLGGTYFPSMR